MAILIHPTRATHDILHIGVRKGDRMYHVLSDVAGAAGGHELRAFVRGCGMRPAWVQYAGTYREHFDAHAHLADCLMRRGARLVTNREVGLLLRAKRGQAVAAPPARPAAREAEPVPDALAAPWWGTIRGVAGEGQLRVLGEVAGRDVLELDPPDAEAGAALARQGARYASVARHDLPGVAAEAFDVVFARRATLDGVADLPDALGALARALRPGGIAAVCAVSPFAGIFPTGGGADPLRPEHSYFDRAPRTGADSLAHYHHTVGDWVAAFAFAGLIVTDLLELEPHPRLWRPGAATEPPWEQLAMLPYTTIWRARKPGGAASEIAG